MASRKVWDEEEAILAVVVKGWWLRVLERIPCVGGLKGLGVRARCSRRDEMRGENMMGWDTPRVTRDEQLIYSSHEGLFEHCIIPRWS